MNLVSASLVTVVISGFVGQALAGSGLPWWLGFMVGIALGGSIGVIAAVLLGVKR